MHVAGVEAEVEDVVLRQAYVFEQLPRRVLEAGSESAALVGGNAFDRLVESDVGLFPVENAREVIAEGVIAHPIIMPALPARPRNGS